MQCPYDNFVELHGVLLDMRVPKEGDYERLAPDGDSDQVTFCREPQSFVVFSPLPDRTPILPSNLGPIPSARALARAFTWATWRDQLAVGR